MGIYIYINKLMHILNKNNNKSQMEKYMMENGKKVLNMVQDCGKGQKAV
jgi:hypothetical protein